MNFTFDDVLLLPQFSTVKSRKDVSLTTKLGLDSLHLPIISSNMTSVTGVAMSQAMLSNGGQSCLHRFQTIEENVKMLKDGILFKSSDEYYTPWVSIGLGEAELERAKALLYAGAHTFVIDVAHGASMSVVEQAKALRELVGEHKMIVVGNFATATSIKEFIKHVGNKTVDIIKVGIGGGSACTTRLVTGCGVPTFSSIVDCASVGMPVIADGGMRNSGDVAKALGAGAHAVMLGKMLAGSDESPSDYIRKVLNSNGLECSHDLKNLSDEQLLNDVTALNHFIKNGLTAIKVNKYKCYKGSASKSSYEDQGKEASHRTPEGASFQIPYTGPVKDTLQQIEAGIRSSMSYVGAHTLDEFRKQAKFIQISNAGIIEGGPHGKSN